MSNRRSSNPVLRCWILLFSVALGMACFAEKVAVARGTEKLTARHKEWLEKEVPYLITKEERNLFLSLQTEADRDKFIERFWEVRNPTPGAPTNPYKEEHYRRIEYANQYFSEGASNNGWRTDRGRVYITLGPPAQKDKRLGYQKIRPMEIWFYSAPHVALPSFFYIVFYERNIGEFRLYSPYFDGPDKLVTSSRGVNNRVQSFKIIDGEVGREVARTTLSLLPDEPVDLQNATTSLQSDLLLSTIRDLADHPMNKLSLDRQRALLENVTARIVTGEDRLRVSTVTLRDANGDADLHYLLRLTHPEDFAVAQEGGGRYYYSLDLNARVLDAQGKLIYVKERKISRRLEESRVSQIKSKTFGYEDLLPLPPGQYTLEFLLDSPITHTAFRASKKIVVPDAPSKGLTLTELVPFTQAESAQRDFTEFLPFSAAGVKFSPLGAQDLTLVPGDKLSFFYAYGRPAAQGDLKSIHDTVERTQFDPYGSLVNGKSIPLDNAAPGNYRMTVTVSDPETKERVYATLAFRILPSSASPRVWDDYDVAAIAHDFREGQTDFERGLCYSALGQRELALKFFSSARQRNLKHEGARAELVRIYVGARDYAKTAALADEPPISARTDPQTILSLSESLDRIGETKRGIALLEDAIKINDQQALFYQALAVCYRKLGDRTRSDQLEQKARSLAGAAFKPSETHE